MSMPTSLSEPPVTAVRQVAALLRPAANDDHSTEPELVWSRLGSGGAPAWVVCPAPGLVALAAPGNHQAHGVLLRCRDGRIWMFELRRGFSSAHEMAGVLEGIAACLAGNPMPEAATRQARDITEVPLRFVAEPVLHSTAVKPWGVSRMAVELALWDESHDSVTDVPRTAYERAINYRQRIQGLLDDALQRFATRLQPRPMRRAMRDGAFDAVLYNYLVLQPHQRYREQLALTFPLLVHAAARASVGSPAQRLVELVDEGKPLIKGLARAWGVSPGAVRCLLHRGSDVIGQLWEEEPWELLKVLDTVTPEDRPAADPAHWRKLERAAAAAREVFGIQPWLSPLASTWMRKCARGGWRALDHLEPAPQLARMLDDSLGQLFCAALCEAVRYAAALSDGANAAAAEAAAMAAVFTQLARLPAKLRERMAIGFGGRLLAGLRRGPGSTQAARWQSLPALLPHDITSSCGTRLLRSVDSSTQLSRHGLLLKNCLHGPRSERYTLACAMGDSFVVAVCDALSGNLLSLADFTPGFVGDSAVASLSLLQHRAAGNTKPSPECIRAVAELNSQLQRGHFDDHLSAIIDRAARHGCRSRALLRAARAGALRREVLAAVEGPFVAALIAEFKTQWAALRRPEEVAPRTPCLPIGLQPAIDCEHAHD